MWTEQRWPYSQLHRGYLPYRKTSARPVTGVTADKLTRRMPLCGCVDMTVIPCRAGIAMPMPASLLT